VTQTLDEGRLRHLRRRFLEASGWFDSEWYSARAGLSRDADALEHYLTHGIVAGVGPNPVVDSLTHPDGPLLEGHDPGSLVPATPLEVEFLRESGYFDRDYYLAMNPGVAQSRLSPLSHFCGWGWKELRRPSPDFDPWWYWATYLDPGSYAINPLLHYALIGQAAGFQPVPSSTHARPGATYEPGAPVRRICLFAGYDRDGVVDETVVAYVRELSRFADVYYLADCHVDASELSKLEGVTCGAWGIRHGAYDFGSFSKLATELVGWEVIDSYDELMLVNDSCYLLRPLDEVFSAMDAKACDWWGMQATKGLARTREAASNQFTEKIPLDVVKRDLLPEFEKDDLYDFHVGSYFTVYRSPVVRDPGFRRQLEAVHDQVNKLLIIQKYEIGLTHYLVGHGFEFDTFVEHLHPFHPLFTETHFTLIAEGFPLLKKYFLYQNHYDTPDLVAWKERVLELVPGAPVAMLERNLVRTSPADRLARSFAVVTGEDGSVVVPRMLSSAEFAAEDEWVPKFDHWWAFPVCAYDHTFAGNERAVFEEVRDDPSIKKIVLTRSRPVAVDGVNVVVVPMDSPEGQHHLLRSRQVFVKHGPRINVPHPMGVKRHNFVNLWHGIPLKRFGFASLDTLPRRRAAVQENARCRAVICSSKVDRLAMTAAFHPLGYEDMWPTGLPRNDFILRSWDRLPPDLRDQELRLRELVGDRRLLLFVPTFKDGQAESYYTFTDEQLHWLARWCERENVVLGVREHMADRARTYSENLAGLGALDLSSGRFPDIEVLYRVGSALITDYSSCVVDFLLTGKPVISFAYDHERYTSTERGLFYSLEEVLPGPVCRDFDELSKGLDDLFRPCDEEEAEVYRWKRSLFFDHVDDQNAWRVVQRVKGLYSAAQGVA
jgi:CDP-glycerol glycerophosphotransferase (TagB/SpsB family)